MFDKREKKWKEILKDPKEKQKIAVGRVKRDLNGSRKI